MRLPRLSVFGIPRAHRLHVLHFLEVGVVGREPEDGDRGHAAIAERRRVVYGAEGLEQRVERAAEDAGLLAGDDDAGALVEEPLEVLLLRAGERTERGHLLGDERGDLLARDGSLGGLCVNLLDGTRVIELLHSGVAVAEPRGERRLSGRQRYRGGACVHLDVVEEVRGLARLERVPRLGDAGILDGALEREALRRVRAQRCALRLRIDLDRDLSPARRSARDDDVMLEHGPWLEAALQLIGERVWVRGERDGDRRCAPHRHVVAVQREVRIARGVEGEQSAGPLGADLLHEFLDERVEAPRAQRVTARERLAPVHVLVLADVVEAEGRQRRHAQGRQGALQLVAALLLQLGRVAAAAAAAVGGHRERDALARARERRHGAAGVDALVVRVREHHERVDAGRPLAGALGGDAGERDLREIDVATGRELRVHRVEERLGLRGDARIVRGHPGGARGPVDERRADQAGDARTIDAGGAVERRRHRRCLAGLLGDDQRVAHGIIGFALVVVRDELLVVHEREPELLEVRLHAVDVVERGVGAELSILRWDEGERERAAGRERAVELAEGLLQILAEVQHAGREHDVERAGLEPRGLERVVDAVAVEVVELGVLVLRFGEHLLRDVDAGDLRARVQIRDRREPGADADVEDALAARGRGGGREARQQRLRRGPAVGRGVDVVLLGPVAVLLLDLLLALGLDLVLHLELRVHRALGRRRGRHRGLPVVADEAVPGRRGLPGVADGLHGPDRADVLDVAHVDLLFNLRDDELLGDGGHMRRRACHLTGPS